MSAAVSIYIYDHTPSGQSRLYRVTQLGADGVHCREFVVSKHNHCCTAAVHTVDPFFPPDFIGSRNWVPMAFTAESPLCPNIVTAVLLLYILWTRFSLPTGVCTSVDSLVHTVQYHMLCFKTYRGTMYYCCTYYERFLPPRLVPVNV